MSAIPTDKQLKNCLLSGWMHLGDGFFGKDDWIGWFEGGKFEKVYAPPSQGLTNAAKSASEQHRLNDLGPIGATVLPGQIVP